MPGAADAGRERVDLADGDQVRGPVAGGGRAVGRQPAEGRARAAAPPRRRRAGARRADARHRRRQQGADLPPDRRARRRPGSGRPPRTGRKAVLMVSSYLPELLGLCDRIAVMRRGRLGPPRPAAGLTEHALMMAATTGAPA